MKRALVVALLFGLAGCGTVKFSATTGSPVTVSGLVSIVNLTFVSDGNGGTINVTVVTLAQQGTAQTVTFCGTQSNLFPINQTVRATFVPGSPCANVVSVTGP